MKLLQVIFFYLINFQIFIKADEISCNFLKFGEEFYICDLSISSQNETLSFSQIYGKHIESKSNQDVMQVAMSGTSKVFPQIICDEFQQIQKIFGFQLNLQQIPQTSLANCSELSYLDLSENNLKDFPLEVFKTNTKLEIINLNDNKLKDLPENLFQHNLKLKKLTLERNLFKNLPSKIFQPINKSLEHLSLYKCDLNGVWKADLLKDAKNLRYFDIGGNNINKIEKGSFHPDNKIVVFLVDENLIDEFEFFHLMNVETIEILYLNGNHLKALDFNVIKQPMNLQIWKANNNTCTKDEMDIFSAASESLEEYLKRKSKIIDGCFESFDALVIETHTNSNEAYKFFSIRSFGLKIELTAMGNADIILSSKPNENNPKLEITLGENNFVSYIKRNGEKVQTVEIERLLDCTEMHEFIIGWTCGFLEVKHLMKTILGQWIDEKIDISFIGIRTRNVSGTWKIAQLSSI